jgi:SAM-dependent methyltransferase
MAPKGNSGLAKFHFVEEYERHVAELIATKPIDEAMSLAVGGSYYEVGSIERDLMCWAGLKDGMFLIDLGCGSGRLAHALGQSLKIELTGVDIVPALLDYARMKCPPNYSFVLNHSLKIPVKERCADFVAVFSVFTHLLHSETYLYLEDIMRVLKPGGKLVFSFLEFANLRHWPLFLSDVNGRRNTEDAPLTTFIERSAIETMAAALGYKLNCYVNSDDAPWGGRPLGQSIAILSRPE